METLKRGTGQKGAAKCRADAAQFAVAQTWMFRCLPVAQTDAKSGVSGWLVCGLRVVWRAAWSGSRKTGYALDDCIVLSFASGRKAGVDGCFYFAKRGERLSCARNA